MLAEADAQFVARDPAIPGLRLLLDDTALAEAIAAAVPIIDLAQAHVDYLRYKPGTNCLARIQLQSSCGQSMAYAFAYRSGSDDKFGKAIFNRDHRPTQPVMLAGSTIALYIFPFDRRLPSLATLNDPSSLRDFLRRAAPQLAGYDDLSAVTLQYKPERRYVACILAGNRPIAAVKTYSADSYRNARRAAKTIGGLCQACWPQCIGHSDRHASILFQWIDGVSLAMLAGDAPPATDAYRRAAHVLCRLHCQRTAKLPSESLDATEQRMLSYLDDLAWISADLAGAAGGLWRSIRDQLHARRPKSLVPIHGDLHLDQLQVCGSKVHLLDFDRARMADPAEDLGALQADLIRRQTATRIDGASQDLLFDAFLAEYAAVSGNVDLRQVRLHAAARLLQAAVEPFRHRHPAWFTESRRLLDSAQLLLKSTHRSSRSPTDSKTAMPRRAPSDLVQVTDPFNLVADAELLGSGDAVDPDIAAERLWNLPSVDGDHAGFELMSINVLRNKAGRRCLIEYEGRSRSTGLSVAVLGKVDAKGRHNRHFERQVKLWNSGFGADAPDGICVARPWGLVPEWNMWLQEKSDGGETWAALQAEGGPHVGRRIARALAKLHHSNLPADRSHRLSDEMATLSVRLVTAARELPDLSARILHLLEDCQRVAGQCVPNSACPIHRDFYPDQVLVTGRQLTLLDFDLFREGDPAVDVGNFRGHLIEHSLRHGRHPNHYAAAEAAFLAEYLHRCPNVSTSTIDIYTLLTLARHVSLCTQIPGRYHNIARVLTTCERFVRAGFMREGSTRPNSLAWSLPSLTELIH